MNVDRQSLLRGLPAVGVLIAEFRRAHSADVEDTLLAHLARERLALLRREILVGNLAEAPSQDQLVESLAADLASWGHSKTCRVVNATGIILHSGLGRAVLPEAVIQEFRNVERYNLLEVEKENGDRRKRDAFCEELLCQITGAEAAMVVNNNAAATMIILNTLAQDREVVVSRSQMVEIGGSYRLPDVMEMSRCQLKEVGTTNKSYPSDYENAISENTGALMLVHTSNYKIVGFTQHVAIEEMVEIGHRHGLPVIDDLGSGTLVDLEPFGISDTPPVQASVKSGADVICFSGDKLVGGPQAGIILGTKEWIQRIRKNPLARAFRVDKLACIALETTLKLYLEPKRLFERVPTLGMLTESAESVADRAKALQERFEEVLGDFANSECLDATSELGAGSLPTHQIPTTCVAVSTDKISAERLARTLRRREISIFPRIREGRVMFDLRTMRPGDCEVVEEALVEILTPNSGEDS